MFAKLFHRNPQESSPRKNDPQLKDFEPHIVVHYGIPSTASILAFDPLQHLLAMGTLDGRIKVIGGDNIECLLISSNPMPLKYLEFLQNQGYLVSVSNENLVQVWDLEQRRLASKLQWESNISAFSVVCDTNYMYVGDEYGYLSVLKFDFEEQNIQHMPYQIPADLIAEEADFPVPSQQSVVGLLAQPCSSGNRVLIAYQIGVIIYKNYIELEHSEKIELFHGNGWQSTAVFSLIKSPVRSLQYTFSGARIIIGHECGKAAVLDVISSSVLFLTDCNNSPIVSISIKTYLQTDINNPDQSDDTSSKDPEKEVAFILTKDAQVILVDIDSGNKICCQSVNPKESTAVSINLLDEKFVVPELPEHNPVSLPHGPIDGKESLQSGTEPESETTEVDKNSSSEVTELSNNFVDSLILICCSDSMLLYSTKSLIQGRSNFIRKIDLEKQCCWTTVFRKNELDSGVILVYSNGVVEIRALPDLNVLAETSIMSILRWNFKTNMEKTMSSFGNTNISMVYGCEFAVISLFTSDNDFRIPEALPHLHDKVVAEAAEAALKFSLTQKNKQTAPTGIIGGIIKGIKREKENENTNIVETQDILVPKLEALFSRTPFSVADLDLDFGDDFDAPIKLVVEKIEVEPKSPEPSTPGQSQGQTEKNKQAERERLFEGGSVNAEPKARTADEIKAKYRKTNTGDTAAVALEAKDKLLERQMKLEKLKENSEELASGSENFADLAGQLAKQMENRKWWQL